MFISFYACQDDNIFCSFYCGPHQWQLSVRSWLRNIFFFNINSILEITWPQHFRSYRIKNWFNFLLSTPATFINVYILKYTLDYLHKAIAKPNEWDIEWYNIYTLLQLYFLPCERTSARAKTKRRWFLESSAYSRVSKNWCQWLLPQKDWIFCARKYIVCD